MRPECGTGDSSPRRSASGFPGHQMSLQKASIPSVLPSVLTGHKSGRRPEKTKKNRSVVTENHGVLFFRFGRHFSKYSGGVLYNRLSLCLLYSFPFFISAGLFYRTRIKIRSQRMGWQYVSKKKQSSVRRGTGVTFHGAGPGSGWQKRRAGERKSR